MFTRLKIEADPPHSPLAERLRKISNNKLRENANFALKMEIDMRLSATILIKKAREEKAAREDNKCLLAGKLMMLKMSSLGIDSVWN